MDFTTLPGSLDLFELLVSYIFGNIALALLGWAVILLVTGIMGRLSMQSTLIIIITYAVVASVGYIGGVAAILVFVIAGWYMVSNLLNALSQLR